MLKPRWQIFAIAALVIALIVGGIILINRPKEPTGTQPFLPPVVGNVHLTMGIPSKATRDIQNANDYLIDDNQRPYALSYNNSKRIPNWVSWQLNKSWLGTAPRTNDFRADPTLPKGWYQVKSSDYNGSGYDRGHMAPSADRAKDIATNSATFLMTNIVPQTPDNNRDVWESLESESRRLANLGKELYIVAGGVGEKGTIGAAKISIPASTWKVIVVLDKPGLRAANVTNKTRVIAVDVPNIQGIKDKTWRDFRVSVDQLEAKTGYNFLTNVPEAVQTAIESRVDRG
ncbi:DNA/RNA non-specific endonuclease [Leptolyngbya boryana CZ1]|uniref:Endonuclease n=1 Tax=Leptolyngbya boryana CZ1 TaxID=3060204 RepID=A0AA96WSC3_LEPBY|nr:MULTISPECIES: DNA/RNA non-specific endonuclease [Leptolyngbya]MBN8559681.1 DNA/RNA non-specific endonuclease [Leptolyngbya sp. UWPOB_LEPTO1]WNZ44880.1 DNA/RNA non-specific endonuclease [Leptolyngbya boryana CZ1]